MYIKEVSNKMEIWFLAGELFKKNRKKAIERRYELYYITVKQDLQNKAFRVVFCNRNGKWVYCDRVIFPNVTDCITAARRIAFHADIRFKMPELE